MRKFRYRTKTNGISTYRCNGWSNQHSLRWHSLWWVHTDSRLKTCVVDYRAPSRNIFLWRWKIKVHNITANLVEILVISPNLVEQVNFRRFCQSAIEMPRFLQPQVQRSHSAFHESIASPILGSSLGFVSDVLDYHIHMIKPKSFRYTVYSMFLPRLEPEKAAESRHVDGWCLKRNESMGFETARVLISIRSHTNERKRTGSCLDCRWLELSAQFTYW